MICKHGGTKIQLRMTYQGVVFADALQLFRLKRSNEEETTRETVVSHGFAHHQRIIGLWRRTGRIDKVELVGRFDAIC